MRDLTFAAAPTLRRFQKCDDFMRFIEGPVGSGKSSACVFELPRRALKQAPWTDNVRRTRFAVIRNTYRELADTTRKTFEEWLPPRLGTFHEQSFTWRSNPLWFADDEHTQRVECEILFRALDRPEDVKKLLSLELTGAYINEVREIPRHVLDILETRIGRYPSKAQGGASWFGIWGDSNPWHTGHWAAKMFAKNLEGYRLFRQPGGRSAHAENIANLPAGYYDRLCRGKSSEWIKVYVDGEDASGDVGAIFGPWVSELDKRGGICAFDHPHDGVFTSWDLGRSDSTAIWFWRLNRLGVPDVIDFYEAAGEGLSHYFNVVDGKPYKYLCHWLPHDAKAKTLATQQSVLDQCVEHWGPSCVGLVPDMLLVDGIEAARWMLEQPIQIHERCAVSGRLEHSGVDALRDYRFEWDEANQCFSSTPLHNWASHTGDAFRYLAIVAKFSRGMAARAEPKAAPPPTRSLDSFTLDELWECKVGGTGGRV